MNIFTDDMRRNPFPVYDQLRAVSPVFRAPPPFDAWLVLDYDGVKRVLHDHDAFSSCVPGPKNWFIFFDPPRHTQLRALIMRAFVPSVVAGLEPRIRAISRELLNKVQDAGEMDLIADYALPLPMRVIAEMIGVPAADWPLYTRWSDAMLQLSQARSGDEAEARVVSDFAAVTAEMSEYVARMIAMRRPNPIEDLLSRLVHAEVDGVQLTHDEILGFFQLLVVGGQETTTNLIANAVLCFLDHPDETARLRTDLQRLPIAIEEVLRHRSPLQWMMRTPRRPIELHGRTLAPGELVLAVIGAANRDPARFESADHFLPNRDPNQHLAFGHGIHACLGAPLARLEARIALTDLLERLGEMSRVESGPWEPRRALHVHGPARLPVRFKRR